MGDAEHTFADLGVIPDSVFCMLVLMAVTTTIMTTPLLLRFMKGTELEPLILESGFLGTQSPGPASHLSPLREVESGA